MTSQQGRGSVMFVAPSAYVLGGLGTWLDYMEPGLRALGWEVLMGLVEGPRHHRPQRYLAKHSHVNWHAIACTTGTQEGRLRAVERAINEFAPDLVATVNLPDALLGAARARRRGRPDLKIAMTVHGIQPDLYDDIRAHRGWLDRVFCTNRLACRLATAFGGVDAARVSHVPYGVDYAGPVLRHSGREPLRIAFVGRLEQDQKRIFDLSPILVELDACGIAYELLIAGSGPDEAALRAALAEPLATGKVRLLGFLSPTELRQQVLERVDALLLTSSWETGPIVIWEAMASGVAVVSSRYIGSGLEAALRHDENALLFPIGDCREAAAQLRRLSQAPALGNRLRAAAFRLIETRYSIPVSVANWDRHLRALREQPALSATPSIKAQPAPGRLDRWLGTGLAEQLRARLGPTGPDGGPGGEWPHSHGTTDYWDPEFWALAKTLDHPAVERSPP
ncbi:glycosyltransferase family 4 protein [uncultured Thiodictyon sp.]|uniref:glycosyltransferase family 4 protein n=1 Tax=uncultured Thiodictyon sp. TaxID=1846217 RepID=UPI0025FC0AD9|nr:glycosyltransferase family 4 protein [uncultured Thiodictyon sp.]